jgi:DNA-binding IclR family transcriptional regulator
MTSSPTMADAEPTSNERPNGSLAGQAPSVLDAAQLQAGTQTLLRGLAILEASAAGARDLKSLGAALGTTRSTTHRLVTSLVHARYLRAGPDGFTLGPRLIELGAVAVDQMPLTSVARPHLEALASETSDTVHLGVRDGNDVLYIHKIAGTRGLEMRSRIGHRMPLATTGIGRALIIDLAAPEWRVLHELALRKAATGKTNVFPPNPSYIARAESGVVGGVPPESFEERMSRYAVRGCTLDVEENEPSICCVAAPIRDASGQVSAAVSVASTAHYMSPERMDALIPVVLRQARAISEELGWRPNARTRTIRR